MSVFSNCHLLALGFCLQCVKLGGLEHVSFAEGSAFSSGDIDRSLIFLKLERVEGLGVVAQLVECSPSMHEALDSVPSTT